MQVTPLNSNHVTAQMQAKEASLQSVAPNAYVKEAQDEAVKLNDPSRVEKIFNTLTRELSEREKDERELALYKSMHPDYLDKETPLYESQLIREKIEEEKSMKSQIAAQSAKVIEASKKDEEAVQNNDAVNAQNRLELQGFVNDFYTLFNSGYTPIDLKI